MLTESKTAYFILISFPTSFHSVKASEMKQETVRARHPVQRTKKSKQKNIWRKSWLKKKHTSPEISLSNYFLCFLLSSVFEEVYSFLFNVLGMVLCCNQCNNGHIVIFFYWSWFQLYHIQCTRNPSSSESGAAVCLCKQNYGVPQTREWGRFTVWWGNAL